MLELGEGDWWGNVGAADMIGSHPVKCWTVAPEAAGCVGSNPTPDRHIYFACFDQIRSYSCTRNVVILLMYNSILLSITQ